MSVSKNWCFTLNNPTVDIEALYDPTIMSYFVGQLEKGTEGTPHIQGYLIFKSNKRLTGCKKVIPEAHWERRKGTHEHARSYCMKEDTSEGPVFEAGEPPSKGKRNDLHEFMKSVDNGMHGLELMQSHALVVAKYPEFARKYSTLSFNESIKTQNKFAITLDHQWQQELYRRLQLPAVKRKIHWVWSRASETGKTSTMQHISGLIPTLSCNTFKKETILHAFDPPRHKIIWFNIPRHMEMNSTTWTVLEELSDQGFQLAAKYESCEKYVEAHVVVTSNQPPPTAQLPRRIIPYKATLGRPNEEQFEAEEICSSAYPCIRNPAFPGKFSD
jgi:hypothetical protein